LSGLAVIAWKQWNHFRSSFIALKGSSASADGKDISRTDILKPEMKKIWARLA
jgi:hypothetical protein